MVIYASLIVLPFLFLSENVAMLTISPNRLREISDPILQMLHQLHKIVYITQVRYIQNILYLFYRNKLNWWAKLIWVMIKCSNMIQVKVSPCDLLFIRKWVARDPTCLWASFNLWWHCLSLLHHCHTFPNPLGSQAPISQLSQLGKACYVSWIFN